jgi:hypothetical protein
MTSNEFLDLIPRTPYAADIACNQVVCSRELAITKRLIQCNAPLFRQWLQFDIDRDDAYFAAERFALCPTVVSVNRQNGHAHISYLVESKVCLSEKAHEAPIQLLKDVENGLRKRLGADPSYSGHLVKNPFHKDWETHFIAQYPYDLVRMADCLDKAEKKGTRGVVIGVGRNCSIFERLRRDAYREVLPFKRQGRTQEDFREVMYQDALRMNARFAHPMVSSEVRGIAQSVAKWVWRKFTVEKFSEIQGKRGSKRWKKETVRHSKPWEALHISESTWYRRKKAGTILIPDMDTQSATQQRDYKLIIPSRPQAIQNPSCPLEAGELS